MRQQLYSAAPNIFHDIQQQIEFQVEVRGIELNHTKWAIPVLLVHKKDGKMRFCVDFQHQIDINVPDAYPLPRVEYCIDSLG